MALLCAPEKGKFIGKRVWVKKDQTLLGCITQDWVSEKYCNLQETDNEDCHNQSCGDSYAKEHLKNDVPCPTGSVFDSIYVGKGTPRCWYKKCTSDCDGWVKQYAENSGRTVGRICVDAKLHAWHIDTKDSNNADDWK